MIPDPSDDTELDRMLGIPQEQKPETLVGITEHIADSEINIQFLGQILSSVLDFSSETLVQSFIFRAEDTNTIKHITDILNNGIGAEFSFIHFASRATGPSGYMIEAKVDVREDIFNNPKTGWLAELRINANTIHTFPIMTIGSYNEGTYAVSSICPNKNTAVEYLANELHII